MATNSLHRSKTRYVANDLRMRTTPIHAASAHQTHLICSLHRTATHLTPHLMKVHFEDRPSLTCIAGYHVMTQLSPVYVCLQGNDETNCCLVWRVVRKWTPSRHTAPGRSHSQTKCMRNVPHSSWTGCCKCNLGCQSTL